MVTPEYGVRLTQPVFRAHHPQWAWSPNSGEGAYRYGGRFNPCKVYALYTSLDYGTAIIEASPLGRFMDPITLCQYEVDCDRLFDSRDPAAMEGEGVSLAELECPNWEREMLEGKIPSSHKAALDLIDRGYRGMIVSSFAIGASGFNVVIWDWSDSPPNQVAVIDPHGRLPHDRSSWT